MDKILRFIISCTLLSMAWMHIFGQFQSFDKAESLGNGLVKVQSSGRWGITDEDGTLKLSVEYNEPFFMNGKAVITEYGSNVLYGYVDSVGNVFQLPPYRINQSFPFITDDMLAIQENKTNGKWGYLNINSMKPIPIVIEKLGKIQDKAFKNIGINGKGTKDVFVIDYATPFNEGIASIYIERSGWHQIDQTGKERFKDADRQPALFRTSLNKGECLIFNHRGVILCSELPDHTAGILRYIDNKPVEIKKYSNGLRYPYMVINNGSKLIMDGRFRADKYENFATGDSVIFIERPPVIVKVEEPKDSFNLSRDLKVEFASTTVSASAKGVASITLNLSNKGEFPSDTIKVTLATKGAKDKIWTGIIPPGATEKITLSVPARFAKASISKTINWVVSSREDELKGDKLVTLRRYKPGKR